MKELRWFGLQKGIPRNAASITRQGYKYNFNNVHALIGISGLCSYPEKLKTTRLIAAEFIKNIECLRHIKHISLEPNTNPSYWLFSALTENYETFSNEFRDRKIAGGAIHKLNHTPFLATKQELKGSMEFNKKLFHIPIGHWLQEDEIQRIIAALKAADDKC